MPSEDIPRLGDPASHPPRGTLADFPAADDIAPLPETGDREWDAIRRVAGRRLAWRFCTLGNLVAYRGRFAFDAMDFAWGGIYRTLLVNSIVTTSFRNEGHFRAGERIGGTSESIRRGLALCGLAPDSRGGRELVEG